MQYCNTPLPHIKLSPTELLLHRQFQDHLPSNPKLYQLCKEWIITAAQREEAFAKINSFIQDKYDTNSHTLPPLNEGTHVAITELHKKHRKRWVKTS